MGEGDSGQIAKRERGEVVGGGALADMSVVQAKITDVAKGVIGMEAGEELDGDTPFMEAGMTSNTAVLLRDELMAELSGVTLPFTLIFDFPSVNAVAEHVVEKAGGG